MELVLCNSRSQTTDEGCKLSWDIMVEILVRLDAKSVTRFKCVSKSWLSLISSPSFMNRHHKRQVPRTLLVIDDFETNFSGLGALFSIRNSENFDQIMDLVCHFMIDPDNFRNGPQDKLLVGSQNGVVCLFNRSDLGVYLWNPAIKKHKKLPPSPTFSPPKSNTNTDTNTETETYSLHGFGYEPWMNDFKVVAVSAPRRVVGGFNYFRGGDQVGVYSLRSNSWRTMEMPDLFSCLVDDSSALITFPRTRTYSVVIGGSIHWLLGFATQSNLDSVAIVAFDLSTEEFKRIAPPISVPAVQVESIYNLSGRLSLLTFGEPGLTEIWIMEKYGSADSWTKHLSVDLVTHLVPPFQSNSFWPIGVSDNGSLLLKSEDYPYDLCFYDRKSNRVQYLSSSKHVMDFTTYAESIFLS